MPGPRPLATTSTKNSPTGCNCSPGRVAARVGTCATKSASAIIHALREELLAPKFNYGAPRVRAESVDRDGSLVLDDDATTDGRGLDLPRAERVLECTACVWRRPVHLRTVDADGRSHEIEAG